MQNDNRPRRGSLNQGKYGRKIFHENFEGKKKGRKEERDRTKVSTVTEISPRGAGLNCSRNAASVSRAFYSSPFFPSFFWLFPRERERGGLSSVRFSASLTIVVRPPVSGIEIGQDSIVRSWREAPEPLPLSASTWCPGYIVSWYECFRLSIPLGFLECFLFVSLRLKHGRAQIDLNVLIGWVWDCDTRFLR